MAWFGESLANIKGQISSFTKEVLTDTPEDEDGQNPNAPGSSYSDELLATQKAFSDLQEFCTKQKKEIDHLKLLAEGFQQKAEALDARNKCLVESHDKLVSNKNEESQNLQSTIDAIRQDEVTRLQHEIEEIRKEYEAKSWVSVEATCKPEVEVISVSVQADEVPKEFGEVGTETDFPLEDLASKAEEESYRKELEERCAAYQQDLYVLRGELMTIQSDADQEEESRAKFNEEVIAILHSDFMSDGHPALAKLKHSSRTDSTRSGEELILSALRQLASLWRGISDQKGALERTVTKLSAHPQTSSLQTDIVELPLNEFQQPSSDLSDSQEDYFPQRLDSFGLETIQEEDRNEVESQDGNSLRSKASIMEVSPKPEVEVNSSCTQTDENNDTQLALETLRSEILASLESLYAEKESAWNETLQQRQTQIHKLESELERLKTHLVDMEDQHTCEMLSGEEKLDELKSQISELQKQLSLMIQQSESSTEVREEISRLETERDFAKAQSSSFEDQNQKLGVQLQNLNFVLEQFQKEKEVEIEGIKKQLKSEINQLQISNKSLIDEVSLERDLLEKARSGLDAARHLNLQIEEKSRIISTLKTQIQEGETEVARLRSQLDEVSNNNVAKIDRYLVKNLVVGYFSSPKDKRQEVLRIIATVLDFNREDRQKTGLESSSLWPFRTEIASGGDSQSLSQAFIKFLETESQPKTQIKIPMEEMARKHSRTPSESSTASGSNQSTSNPLSPSATEISMTLPVLNQADRSNSILKDVLNPRT